ncbi:MAG: DNA polymerase IV [SAR324 cluster bacterium]|nr:DNA polymerase IV [SAR324 cluster bacterium]
MTKIVLFKEGDEANINPILLKRKIIHVDMDAFFASVEALDNPSLKGKPFVVGGKATERGIIATANYKAREYGIKSAMPTARALTLCPNLIIVKPRHDRYVDISKKLSLILTEFSPILEKPSLDEAYLDVTGNYHHDNASKVAIKIINSIKNKLNLTCSAGTAPNKLLAKIASDFTKPNGLTVILPKAVRNFMQYLPLTKIPGVGKVTAKKLAFINAHKCGDIWKLPIEDLSKTLGKYGVSLHSLAQGLDESSVKKSRIRKSYGLERTFRQDLITSEDKEKSLQVIKDKLIIMIDKYNIKAHTLSLKVRYKNFQTITRSVTQIEVINSTNLTKLINKLWQSRIDHNRSVRLLGLTLSNLRIIKNNDHNKNLTLF